MTENPMSKACRFCQSPIASKAIKCIKCGERLDVWGRVRISQSVLALLVALFSVVGIVTPVFKATFIDAAESEINAIYQYVNGEEIVLWVTNSGTRAGSIGDLLLSFEIGSNEFEWLPDETARLAFTAQKSDGAVLVRAQEAHPISFSLGASGGFMVNFSSLRLEKFQNVYSAGTNCKLSLVTFGFSGQKRAIPVQVSCDSLARLAVAVLQ
jgi:hypothetical protein